MRRFRVKLFQEADSEGRVTLASGGQRYYIPKVEDNAFIDSMNKPAICRLLFFNLKYL